MAEADRKLDDLAANLQGVNGRCIILAETGPMTDEWEVVTIDPLGKELRLNQPVPSTRRAGDAAEVVPREEIGTVVRQIVSLTRRTYSGHDGL